MINNNNTTNPHSGNASISLENLGSTGAFTTLTPPAPRSFTGFTNFQFYLYNTSQWADNTRIKVAFFNGSTQVSSFVSVRNGFYGQVSTVLGAYQSIIIPKDDFQIRGNVFTSVQFQYENIPSAITYLDSFYEIGGMENPPRFGSVKALSDMPDS